MTAPRLTHHRRFLELETVPNAKGTGPGAFPGKSTTIHASEKMPGLLTSSGIFSDKFFRV